MKLFVTLLTSLLIVVFTVNGFATENKISFVDSESYLDIATGHRYVKNSETTYKEYSKKGVLLRTTVPHNLPLLTNNKNIRKLGGNSYLLYEKWTGHTLKKQLLPAFSNHPAGWSCKAAYTSLLGISKTKDMGLGYSNSPVTFPNDVQHVAASDEVYFDVATGHRYVKNSETTYKEYSKKGELLRTNVPQGLPLLTTNRYIKKIGENSYLLYEKWAGYTLKKQLLPAFSNHPAGWSCKSAMMSLKTHSEF